MRRPHSQNTPGRFLLQRRSPPAAFDAPLFLPPISCPRAAIYPSMCMREHMQEHMLACAYVSPPLPLPHAARLALQAGGRDNPSMQEKRERAEAQRFIWEPLPQLSNISITGVRLEMQAAAIRECVWEKGRAI